MSSQTLNRVYYMKLYSPRIFFIIKTFELISFNKKKLFISYPDQPNPKLIPQAKAWRIKN